jgi:hypothetical protein
VAAVSAATLVYPPRRARDTRASTVLACVLQITRVKRVALAEIARLVAAAEPANTLFGRAVRK